MKKKTILIILSFFASFALFSCDEKEVKDTVNQIVHDRGQKEESKSEDIKYPDLILPTKEETDEPTEPESQEPSGPTESTEPESQEPSLPDVNADETIDFDGGTVVETDAGTGYSQKLDEGEMLFATTNIGYEFIGWYLGNKLLSTDSFYQTGKDEVGVTAKYKLKEEFEYLVFTSNETECVLTGVKDNCPSVLVLPEGITKISYSAFYEKNVNILTLPNSLNELDYGALAGSNIYSLTIKSMPKTIGNDVVNYSKIREIYLPDGEYDSSILNQKFVNYNYYNPITFKDADDESNYFIVGDFVFTIDEGSLTAVSYVGNNKEITFPDLKDFTGLDDEYDCYYLTDNMFRENNNIEKVTISSLIPYIPDNCFRSCENLKEVIISAGVLGIGDDAFENCTSLEKVVIGDNVQTIGDYAFSECNNLNDLTLGSGINTIYSYAFYNCNSLSEIIIPSSVGSIEDHAFEGCTNLYTVYDLSNNLFVSKDSTSNGCVGFYALSVMHSLDEENPVLEHQGFKYTINENVKTILLLKYVGNEKDIVIPTFDKYDIVLGEGLFSKYSSNPNSGILNPIPNPGVISSFNGRLNNSINNSNDEDANEIESVTLNEYVIEILDNAFNGCSKLESFDAMNVEDIGDRAFANCTSLKTFIGDNISEINIDSYTNSPFYGCVNLRSVSLEKIGSVSDYLFYECSKLKEVNIPVITSIGEESFYHCYNLEKLDLPEGLTTIGYQAFYECFSLYQVILPSTLTSIGSYAFYHCYNLVEVINKSNINISKGAGTYGYIAYSARSVITDLKNSIIDEENGFVTFSDENNNNEVTLLNYADESVKKLVIPSEIKFINKAALYGIDLEELEIHQAFRHYDDGDGYVENNCFGYMFGAESRWYNDTFIPETLKKVILGDEITTLPDYTFYGCEYINDIVLSSNLETICEDVFGGEEDYPAPQIENVYYNGTIDDWCNIYFQYEESNPLSTGKANFYLKDGNDYVKPTKIVISSEITSIGDYQFMGMKLEEVTISNSLTTIGRKAFYNCGLKVLNLSSPAEDKGENTSPVLANVGDYAFAYNSYINKVIIPSSLESISEGLFYNCINLQYVKLEEGVQSIGSEAFANCRLLYTLIIPSTLNYISGGAFKNCENIENVDLSKASVADIYDETFKNCKSLVTIAFSSNLNSIGNTSFEGCNKLHYEQYKNGCYFGTEENPYKWLVKARAKTIVDCTVHPDCEKIYSSAFSQCTYLKKLIINEKCFDFAECLKGLTKIEYVEFPYASSSKIGSLLFGEYYNSSIPSTLKTVVINGEHDIPNYAFQSFNSLTTVRITGTLTSIGNYAFDDCSYLTNVEFPDTLTSIGQYAFRATGLTEITANSTWNSLGSHVFENCASLEKIDLSEFNFNSTYSISEYAFSNCRKLNVVTLPNNISYIPTRMFSDCTALTSISFPDSVESIGAYSFYNTGLTAIDFNKVKGINNYAFQNCKHLETVDLNANITTFGTYMFKNCDGLTSATLRRKTAEGIFDDCDNLANVTIASDMTIMKYAFRNCVSLKSINLLRIGSIGVNAFEGSGLTSVSTTNGITIEQSAFKNCKELVSVSFTGTSKNTFSTGMFEGCSKLSTVTWPSNVKTVPVSTFKDCESLASFDFDKVELIDCNAFQNTGFTSVVLPNTISYIETESFSNCLKLSSLQINCKLTRSGNNPPERMFAGCKALKTVVMNNDDDFIPCEAFKDCSSLDTFTYGTNVTEIRKSAFYGCGFDTLNIPSKVTIVGERAFAYNKFTELSIPSTISTLGSYAFAYNKDLTKVVLNYIDNISSDIFYQCSSLTDVTLPSGLETITSYMFGYTALKTITLPVSIKKIESYAFYNCSSLETITISRNVTSIGTSAFQNCTSLSIVKNYSELNIEAGSTSYGYVGYYAKTVESPFADESNFVEDENGYKFAYVDGKGYLMGYEGNNTALSLPESFEFNHEIIEEYEIFSNAFAGMNIIKITIPNNVTAIWDGAFDECVKLVEVYNYSSLDILQGKADNGKVGYYALVIHNAQEDSIIVEDANGFLLTKYTDNNTTIGTVIGYVGPETEITIPITFTFGSDEINVKTIYDNAFVGTSITSVIIPDGITNIGSYAFKNIKSLEEIVVPSNVECGSNPFASCSIVKATIPTSMIKYINYTDANNTKLEEVTINGGTSIDANAFKDCRNLTKVVLPDTLETIGSYAFGNCSNMTSINLPNSLTSIGQYSFTQCAGLKGIILPESLTSIPAYAFSYCTPLQYIVLPKTIKSIGSNAFIKNDAIGMNVFCLGEESEFSSITIMTRYSSFYGYTYATKYYYSEDEPTVSNKYWHYVDGVPTIWVI